MALDKRDYKLLYLLDKQGRSSVSDLAKSIKLSKQATQARINKLEQQEYITGYYPLIDQASLGYTSYRVYFTLRNATPDKRKVLIDFLIGYAGVWALASETGLADIAIAINIKDVQEFHAFWQELHSRFADIIKEQDLSIYARVLHFSCAYLISEPSDDEARVVGERQRINIDETDLRILLLLASDARTSLVSMGSSIGLTPEAIAKRLRRLERGVIIGYRANINHAKLGYQFFKAELRLNDYRFTDLIIDYCRRHPNIYQLNRIIGRSSLEIEIHVKTIHDFVSVMNKLQEMYPDAIESYTHLQVLTMEKFTYL